jgi:glycosyltransferase domain-containing protein
MDKNIDLREHFTLVVPSYNNRRKFLNRLCEYYATANFSILIVDSSVKPQNLHFKNQNIKYIHCPTLNYYEKLKLAVDSINTPYASLCADDDFLIPFGIEQCISFLTENLQYSSCQGTSSYFFNSFYTKFYPLFSNRYNFDVLQNNPIERINYLFDNYMYLHYSVHRTEVLKDITSHLIATPPKLYGLVEFFFNIISLTGGKHKTINVLYSIRQFDLNSAYHKYPKIHEVKTSLEANKELEKIKLTLAEYLTKNGNCDILEAIKGIDFVFNESSFFYKNNSENEKNNGEIIRNNSVKKIINTIPFIKCLKTFYTYSILKTRRFKEHYYLSRKKSIIINAQHLEGYPNLNFKDNEELCKIHSIIRKHIITF